VKVALVTGANKGIGYAIAERLLRDGYSLGYATRTRDDASREAMLRLSALGSTHWVYGDLTDAEVPPRLVEETVQRFGRIDVLVNNAGLSTAKPALELTAEDLDALLRLDVRAAFLASQAAARVMADEGGVIVNVTSVHEYTPRAGLTVYAAAKAALGMLTKGLALELAPKVRVVSVAPGLIDTERNVEAEGLGPKVPFGRAGRPEEVAAAVAFLCSDDASYVSGASLLVDGALLQRPLSAPAGS
jgi:NAD(P)-dependent dehydrogenase (short-subunit alcohol dehydrogenase family)